MKNKKKPKNITKSYSLTKKQESAVEKSIKEGQLKCKEIAFIVMESRIDMSVFFDHELD